MATYIPRGYETYVPPIAVAPTPASHPIPPVPVPISPISFPLDPTRYYLLGQLEYYLSPQNMAQDFFLRQRMDSRGWIPVSLIASFNRVRQVTIDAQLVRDVLLLSSVVEVKGEWVRMVSWEQFVLPDAMPSKIERVDLEFEEPHDAPNHKEHIRQGPEEEDVVFVMGREEGVSWSPEKRT
ncbi:winged helix DNA-binding domain-containing protein [Lyophyllum atratum]|nr:winged helix DNA-binding domain-containing protein [Lyophyllum atratum]